MSEQDRSAVQLALKNLGRALDFLSMCEGEELERITFELSCREVELTSMLEQETV